MAPAKLERSETGAAAIGRSIYLVGGFVGPLGPLGFRTTSQVERYDVDADRWVFVKPMPVTLNHPSAVAYHGDLYVLGGYTNGFSNPGVPTGGVADTSDAFLRYRPASDSWSWMPRMPIGRTAAAAAVIGDRLYVAGGRHRLPSFLTTEGLLKRLDVFDFRSQTWTRGPDMSAAREHVQGVAAGGAFYALGGRAAPASTALVERYLPSERRWERVPDMHFARNGFGAAAVDGRLVVFGAEEPGTAEFRLENAATELFDPGAGRWSRLADMLTPRGGFPGVAVGRRVYAIGGLLPRPETTCCTGSNLLEALDVPAATSTGLGNCLARRSPIGPRNIGRIRLGYTRRALLRRVRVPPARRTAWSFAYCVKGRSGRVTSVFSRRSQPGRVQLVTTTARGHGNRGVRVGSRRRTFRRAYPARRRLIGGVYQARPGSSRLIGLRQGRVRFMAVGTARLLRNRGALRRSLQRAGL